MAFDSEVGTEAVVWVYDLAGTSAMRRLTFGGKNRAPIWSSDGQWVAFQSDREGDLAIFRQRADGSGLAERLTKPETGASHTPLSWSPDGAHVLFSVQSGQQFTLWTMNLKDRRTSAFGNVQSGIHPEGQFSPDGRWIVYQSRDTFTELAAATTQVFVQPFPATGAKYQVPQAGGSPHWFGKGRELILNTAQGRSVAIGFTTSPQVGFGRPADFPRTGRNEGPIAITRRNVDAMPDGEHIIGVTSELAALPGANVVPPITVVLNWFDEVRQRAPRK